MDQGELTKKMHEIDKTLAAHLQECFLQNRQVWHELRALKNVAWVAAIGIFSTLTLITGALAKNFLKL